MDPVVVEGPVVGIGMPADSNDVLIGDSFQFQLEFENTSSVVGYGPYIDLYLPKGMDGNDGVSIASSGAITYLGQSVNYQIITLGEVGGRTHAAGRAGG